MIAALAAEIAGLAVGPDRFIVGLAGAPGAGKSTLADALALALNAVGPCARVVPMDGFHYDDRVLGPRGDLPRKGAPHTFDAMGFVHLVRRLKTEPEVAIPVFDRSIEIARGGADIVTAADRIVIVEGNYLLLDADPWRQLHPLFDLTVFLQVREAELERRLVARWTGFGHTEADARIRAAANDLPNARLVARGSVSADRVVKLTGGGAGGECGASGGDI